MKNFDPSKAHSPRAVERRSRRDRRKKRFSDIQWLFKKGRRRQVRRKSDKRGIHLLDYYPPKLLLFLVAILLLSILDAFLTLWLIDNGAVELNPIMDYYLNHGPGVFMAVKYYLTAAVVTLTVLFNYVFVKFFRIQFGQMLKVYVGCFSMVIVWELFLIASLKI